MKTEEIKKTENMEPETDAAELALINDDGSNEIAAAGMFDKMNLARDIIGGGRGWCSMTAADNKSRVTLFNACSNPEKLSTMINKRIKLLHVYAEIIQCAHVNENGGEVSFVSCPRVILIDENGKGYQAVSVGIYNSVKRIISLFGSPETWDRPHTVEVQNVDLKGGQHTFNLIMID